MSSRRRYLAIINPHSGTGRKTSIPELAHKVLDDPDLDLYTIYTRGPGEATRIIKEASQLFNVEAIIAVGGDGTINEIAQAVHSTQMTLGIVPAGSGNGLARSLGIPMSAEGALEVIRAGYKRSIDCCMANDHPFFVTFGVGFDAQVTASYDQKSFRGPISYILATIDQFIKHRPQQYRITMGGETIEQEAFLITCANADQYGNNAYIAPNAEPDDGLLDVVVIRNIPLLQAPHMAVSLFSKQIQNNAQVDIYRTAQLTIESELPLLAHVDGESIQVGAHIDLSVSSRQLSIFVPTP